MKVDIITRHSVPNYGSLLQSYATQKTIEEMGFESEIINYTRYEERYRNLVNSLIKGKKWDKNIITRAIYKIIQTPNYAKMYKKFEKYRKNFLKESNLVYGNLQELKDNVPEADVYCSGSDQIWGKIGTLEYVEAYFLKFIENKQKKCISYSSSFGKEKIDGNLEKNIKELLKNYSDILVREDTAKKILKKQGFENVEQVLDPTLLLNKEQWEKLANKVKLKYNKYVLVYQLHDNKKFDKYAKEFAKRAGLKLLRISPSIYHITRSGKLIYLPDQYKFLSLFQNAEYILTDSFHATVFSIIFNKKFVDILPGKTSTRIVSILNLTGLQKQILEKYDDFSFINKDVNFTECNKVIEKEREKSIELLRNAIVGKDDRTVDLLDKHYKCTGCKTCEQICPVKAIDMMEDEEGFYKPRINKEKCIKCGKCYKNCPQLNCIEKNKEFNQLNVYAIKNKNKTEQKTSSSGGVFSALAHYVLSNDGIVYGASFCENFKLKQTRIDKLDELYRLKGSKYLQSDTSEIFELVKEDLINNKLVLYVGTPCQIGGLKNYLGKDYNNLLLVDLLCHGVPSQRLFNEYINWLEKREKSKVKMYDFRNKEKSIWELGYIPKVSFENGRDKYLYGDTDIYIKSFLRGNTLMEACYSCKYTKMERISDITIGDLWGVGKAYPKLYDENGVSLVLINTINGKEAINEIKDNLCVKEIKINEIIKYTQPLCQPTKRPNDRSHYVINLIKKLKNNKVKNVINIKDIIKQCTPMSIRKKIRKIN